LLRVAPSRSARSSTEGAGGGRDRPGRALLWLLLLRVNGTPVANVPSILVLMTALTTLVVALAIVISASHDRRAAQFLYSIGVLVLFGGATAMAGGPANAVARLAIDSADVTTTALVVAYVGIAGSRMSGFGPSSRRTGSRTGATIAL